jgi:hypothetical protein
MILTTHIEQSVNLRAREGIKFVIRVDKGGDGGNLGLIRASFAQRAL